MSYRTESFHDAATDDQIARVAPSVFASTPSVRVSESYKHITTSDILRGLRGEGWNVHHVTSTNARGVRLLHTKHMLRLRQAGQVHDDAGVPEIILLNSSDRTSSVALYGGLVRWACMNGIIAGEGTLASVRLLHSGQVAMRVAEAVSDLVRQMPKLVDMRDAMRSVQLSRTERHLFAMRALTLAYGEKAPIRANQVLEVRRDEDKGTDLWSTFNVVQENLLRGGLPGRASTGRRLATRAVRSIDRNVVLNRALWQLADEARVAGGLDDTPIGGQRQLVLEAA